jgi:hypothetical protein
MRGGNERKMEKNHSAKLKKKRKTKQRLITTKEQKNERGNF